VNPFKGVGLVGQMVNQTVPSLMQLNLISGVNTVLEKTMFAHFKSISTCLEKEVTIPVTKFGQDQIEEKLIGKILKETQTDQYLYGVIYKVRNFIARRLQLPASLHNYC